MVHDVCGSTKNIEKNSINIQISVQITEVISETSKILRLQKEFTSDVSAICESNNLRPPMTMRACTIAINILSMLSIL